MKSISYPRLVLFRKEAEITRNTGFLAGCKPGLQVGSGSVILDDTQESSIMFRMLALMVTMLAAMGDSMGQTIVSERKDWCMSQCDLAGDERANAAQIYAQVDDYALGQNSAPDAMVFPIRVGIIQSGNEGSEVKKAKAYQAIKNLNAAFARTGLKFIMDRIEIISSDLKIEDLSHNYYQPYDDFSATHDLDSMISLFIFDHAEDFCQTTTTSISCGRKGGFSYILSAKTNNVALSTFDLDDQKIIAHEFGHFFGLYHTFEESQYGKDYPGNNACDQAGDRICDTPPDPGSVYEVYVNYFNCEMVGFRDSTGLEYQPLITNYMSYYKPCYLREYTFTLGQVEVLRSAAMSSLRQKFSRVN